LVEVGSSNAHQAHFAGNASGHLAE